MLPFPDRRGAGSEVVVAPGVRADLAAYAKAMGNGFPVAAVAGRDAIMAMVEPGRVASGGTYCGNVVAASAAAATLEIIESQPVIETIFARGRMLMDGISALLARRSIAHAVTGVPSMFSVLLGRDTPPTDYRFYSTFDAELFGKLGTALIANGVLVDDDPREPWFLSYSHSEAVIAVIADTRERVEMAITHAFGARKAARRAA